MPISLRPAEISDLESINNIYNQAVAQRRQTADAEPVDMDRRLQWFRSHDRDRYTIQIIELDNFIIGWSSLSRYREGRQALQSTAQISYYIHSDYQSLGYGSYLIEQTIKVGQENGFINLVALLLSSNIASMGILLKFQFEEWGRIPSAALIENQWFDHLFYGLRIKTN